MSRVCCGKHQKPAEVTYLADFGNASLQYRKRFADNTSGNLKTVFSLVSVLCVQYDNCECRKRFADSGIKKRLSREAYSLKLYTCFAGILATSGHVSSAAMFNTVVMGGAQGLYAACVKDTYACINEHTRNIALQGAYAAN